MTNKTDQTDLQQAFFQTLRAKGFAGDIDTSLATRTVFATDNSIYQLVPSAVIAPKNHQDLCHIGHLLSLSQFRHITITARGGGTGTNGQSLTPGIILDTSKYLTQILEINPKEGWVRVQAGVIRDQLNDALKPYQLFFAPSLSTSNRATLGGMTNTDACGQGSMVYGRTSDHILEITCVLTNGHSHTVQSYTHQSQFEQQGKPAITELYQTLQQKLEQNQAVIERDFPKLQRYMTGYNLRQCCQGQALNLNKLIAGSEGTLAIVSELKLNVVPIPQCKQVFALFYDNFQEALKSATELLSFKPSSIETIDDNILNLAKQNPIYVKLASFFADELPNNIQALSLLEFSADNAAELEQKTNDFLTQLQSKKLTIQPLTFLSTQEPEQIETLWNLRKQSVGLLGNTPGTRRPLPFIEDTVVPPEHLADYIFELRQVLDRHGLHYGMFGHIDVGCLHVRPALDLKQSQDKALIQIITDETVRLVRKYHGLLWGEHGKGLRGGDYLKAHIGPDLYQLMREIKGLFDPYNQLNPGKLVSSPYKPQALLPLMSPMRGDFDRQISKTDFDRYQSALYCNGNGACFTYQNQQIICPSYKAENNRLHSPKGRASLLREWLRLKANNKNLSAEFEDQVFASLETCLGCKACATACPVQVHIPNNKAKFLQHYYQNKAHKRPIKDHLIGKLESTLMLQSTVPRVSNFLIHNKLSRSILRHAIGLTDLPKLAAPNLKKRCKKHSIHLLANEQLALLSKHKHSKSVLLVQDPLSSFYEPDLVVQACLLLKNCGIEPVILPFRPNGKALHVKGFLQNFKELVRENIAFYNNLSKYDIAMVSLEASTASCYQDEYLDLIKSESLDISPSFKIDLFSEWLYNTLTVNKAISKQAIKIAKQQKTYYLIQHCTEQSIFPASAQHWQALFKYFGLELKVINTGCCGMAGSFGHETQHQKSSKTLFDRHIAPILEQYSPESLLATGFSCRAQVERFAKLKLQHPLFQLQQIIG